MKEQVRRITGKIILFAIIFIGATPFFNINTDAETIEYITVSNTDSQGLYYTLNPTDMTASVKSDPSYGPREIITIPIKVIKNEVSYTVTGIDNYAFAGSRIKEITLSNSITNIGDYAFLICRNLSKIIVSADNAFFSSDEYGALYNKDKTILIQYPCASATSKYTLPASVTSIYNNAFLDCLNLTNITAAPDNNTFSSDNSGVLFTKNKTILVQYPIGKTRREYTVPDGVAEIGDYAFYRCMSLESVHLPGGVTRIGEGAFADCNALKEITLPDSITSIGQSAFEATPWLYNAPEELYIGKFFYRYKNRDSVSSYALLDGTVGIAGFAFRGSGNLTNVIIPESVKNINHYSFFFGSVSNITVVEANPYFSSDESGILYNKDGTEIICYPPGKKEAKYTIPDGVTTIGEFSFSSNYNLKNITLPSSITTIKDYAFNNPLSAITIPASVTYISVNAIQKDTVVYGRRNSYIEDYCAENNIKFYDYIEGIIKKIDGLASDSFILKNQYYIDELIQSYNELSDADKNEVTNASTLLNITERINNLKFFPVYESDLLDGIISIHSPLGVLPKGVAVEAEKTNPSEQQIKLLKKQLGNESAFITLFSISIYDADNAIISPNAEHGAVHATVKIDDDFVDSIFLTAVFIDEEGNFTELETEIKDGFAVFPTETAGLYALIEKGGKINGNNTFIIIITAVITLTVIIALAVYAYLKKKKVGEANNIPDNEQLNT